MQLTLDIPETLADRLIAAGKDPGCAALEALAVEGYRSHLLSEAEVRRMLGLETRMEAHMLLAAHDVPLHYTEEHLRQDIQASDQLAAQRSFSPSHTA
jgi:predicted HTH domain antitoxin